MSVEYGKNISIPDEVLCAQVAAGNRAAEETLVLRYARLVRVCARPLFLAGGDSEDLIQEGMLGLLAAIRRYQPDQGPGFGPLPNSASAAGFSPLCARPPVESTPPE